MGGPLGCGNGHGGGGANLCWPGGWPYAARALSSKPDTHGAQPCWPSADPRSTSTFELFKIRPDGTRRALIAQLPFAPRFIDWGTNP